MSTGLECEFVERQPGVWFYILEHWDAPKNSWDWHDFATAYGPFESEETAREHLSDNHANPGSSSTERFIGAAESESLKKVLDNAVDPRKKRPWQ